MQSSMLSKLLVVSLLSLLVWVPLDSRGAAPSGGENEKEEADNGYDKKLTKLNTYQSEMKSVRASLQESIKELRGTAKNDPNYNAVKERVIILYEDYDRAVKNFNEVGRELQHQFPEKSNLTKRKYAPYRVQSIEQIEKELDLDDVLTDAGEAVYKKYRAFAPKEEKRVLKKKKKKKKKQDRQKGIEMSF